MSGAATYARDRETQRHTGGVYLNPLHWASKTVHAFRSWTGEKTMVTWCGLDADLTQEARQTTDLISCLQCGQSTYDALGLGRP